MKPTIKKIMAVLLSAILVLSMVGCGEKKDSAAKPGVQVTAEEAAKLAVQALLDALKAADMEAAKKFLTTEGAVSELEGVLTYEPFMKLLFDSLDYKILSAEKADENTVTVTAQITARDMKPVIQAALEKLINFALEANFAQTPLSEEAYAQKTLEIYTQAMEETENTTVTNTVSVPVKKENDVWTVQADAAFANAVLGGLQTAVQDIVSEMNVAQ